MGDTSDRNDTFEYLKLLLPRGDQSAAEFNQAIKNFFSYALVFFLLHLFKTTELEFFGAKFAIPQEWLAVAAPVVLSFFYLRIATLYELQQNYKIEIERTSRKYFGDSEYAKVQSSKISKTVFWYVNPSMADNLDRRGLFYVFAYILITLSALLMVFIVPAGITSFFIWVLWQTKAIPSVIIIVFSIISGISSFIGLILSIQQITIEPKEPNDK